MSSSIFRASFAGASALFAAWGCGSDVSDTSFPTSSGTGAHSASGGNSQVGGHAQSGGGGQGGANLGGSSEVGGTAQGGANVGGGGANVGGGNIGGSSGTGGSGTGGNSSCQSLGDACSDCAFANCDAQYCACYGNLACDNLAVCFSQCRPGDADCAQTCETNNSGGISDFFLLDNCSAGSCSNDCADTTKLTPCQICLFTSCDTEMNTCLALPACAAILDCVAQCGQFDATCPARCEAAHPTGKNQADAVGQCSNTHCRNQCP